MIFQHNGKLNHRKCWVVRCKVNEITRVSPSSSWQGFLGVGPGDSLAPLQSRSAPDAVLECFWVCSCLGCVSGSYCRSFPLWWLLGGSPGRSGPGEYREEEIHLAPSKEEGVSFPCLPFLPLHPPSRMHPHRHTQTHNTSSLLTVIRN